MYCKLISVTVFHNILNSFHRQKLDIAGCPWPVLLCTYFCERQQTTADQSFDVLPQYVRGYNAVMIMLLTFVNLQWVTVEHHSMWFRAIEKSRPVGQASRISFQSFHADLLNGRAAPGTLCANTLWFQNEEVNLLMDITALGKKSLRVHSFEVIWTRINDPRSVWTLVHQRNQRIHSGHGFVPFMHHDPSDLGSLILIQITPKGMHLKRCFIQSAVGLELTFFSSPDCTRDNYSK